MKKVPMYSPEVTSARESTAGNLCSLQERMQCTRSKADSLHLHEEAQWNIEFREGTLLCGRHLQLHHLLAPGKDVVHAQ